MMAELQQEETGPLPKRQVLQAVMFAVVCLVIFLANRRHVGSGDCVPATYLPIALARGDGPWLDRFGPFLQSPTGQWPGYCEESRGHVVSRYPMGPGLVITPLVVPQVYVWDWLEPSWASHADTFQLTARRMAKNSAALVAAAGAGLLWFWLRARFSAPAATLATLAAAMGSDLWAVGSQAAWQHGPALFCLMLAVLCLDFGRGRLWAAWLGGFFTAMIVVCRPVDLPITLALWLYALTCGRVWRRWFTLSAAIMAVAWSGWNLYFFDHMTGGYSEIEKMHGWAHGVQGSWSTPLLHGLAGTLLSPSHGLLVYCPWVLFAVAGFWRIWRLGPQPEMQLPRILTLSLVPTLLILSKYSCWWGGHCFGPRFWVDSMPVFALGLAAAIASVESCRLNLRNFILIGLVLAIFWSMTIQAVAAWTYPTSWHSTPTNADKDHKRLWDWHDQELSRGLKEGPHPPQWRGLF